MHLDEAAIGRATLETSDVSADLPALDLPALDLLNALHTRTLELGLAPPAALIGDWCGADAVIAPSIEVRAGVRPPAQPTGFWFGYLGFPAYPARLPAAADLPEVVGGLTDGVLMLRGRRWEFHGPGGHDDATCPDWVREVIEHPRGTTRTESGPQPDPRPTAPRRPAWSATWTAPPRAPHLAAIESCLSAIRAGEVYQACVCTAFTGHLDGDPLAWFRSVAGTTAPAKAAFLQGDWGTVASFSPETFLSRRGATVSSSPIKGTLPADADPTALATSAKDIAENVMIVDLVRNDLGRVAAVGSVRVPELLTVVPAPGVWHLVSTVTATLHDTDGTDDLLDAAFPPASVTGTPKLRALELLAGWEETSRGVYCGAVGIAGPQHLLDLNVAIRTVAIARDGTTTLGVGGGITIDSDPAREWQECMDKAASIVGHEPECNGAGGLTSLHGDQDSAGYGAGGARR